MLIQNGDYQIDESKNIVRYISFTKFTDLILTEKIFFVNASKLTDQYEFRLTDIHENQVLTTFSKFYDKTKAQEILEVYRNTMKVHRTQFYVNSWSEEMQESYALWKIYLGGQDGVSIKTDFKSLKKAFEKSEKSVEIGKVKYDEKLSEYLNPNLVYRKRNYYEYEKEVRLCYYSTKFDTGVIEDKASENGPISPKEYRELNFNGFKEKVDLLSLIKEIRISPFSNASFRQLIIDLLERIQPELVNRIAISEIKDK